MWDLSTALELANKADRKLPLPLIDIIKSYAVILLLFSVTCVKVCFIQYFDYSKLEFLP